LAEPGLTLAIVGLIFIGGATAVVVVIDFGVVVVVGVVEVEAVVVVGVVLAVVVVVVVVVEVVVVGVVAVVVVVDESAAMTGMAEIASTVKTTAERIPINNLRGSLAIIFISYSN
jgi:hypothetical protein